MDMEHLVSVLDVLRILFNLDFEKLGCCTRMLQESIFSFYEKTFILELVSIIISLVWYTFLTYCFKILIHFLIAIGFFRAKQAKWKVMIKI